MKRINEQTLRRIIKRELLKEEEGFDWSDDIGTVRARQGNANLIVAIDNMLDKIEEKMSFLETNKKFVDQETIAPVIRELQIAYKSFENAIAIIER